MQKCQHKIALAANRKFVKFEKSNDTPLLTSISNKNA
jgi:hypothetical protein